MAETILITGANRGIGLELVKIFARNDWQVLACCRHPEQAKELKALSDSGTITLYALDVNDKEAIKRLAAGLAEKPIDILLNNAGIYGPENQQLNHLDAEAWVQVFRTNVIAPVKMVESFTDQVVRSERKIIASIGSMMGSLTDNTSGGHYIYRTSKAAIHMVMKSLSIDLKSQGVTSIALHPGWVRTRMGGPEAPTSPEESAAGLYQVLTNLGPDDNGKFLTFEGKELPW